MIDKLLYLETIFVEYIHLATGKTLLSFIQKVHPEYEVLETIQEEGKVRHNMKEVAA